MICQPIRYVLPKSAFLLEVYYDKNGDFKEQPKWDTDGNKLTELDVSKNPELELLDCRDNNLTRLDVTNNTKLIVLHCQKNKLSQLNVTKNTNLHYLECRDNRMRDLDASNMAFDSEGNYTLYCGNQTTDRSTTQILALTLREDMKSHWETGLKSHRFNTNVQLVQ